MFSYRCLWKQDVFNTGVMQTYVFAKEYFEGANRFKTYHEQNFADLTVSPSKPAFSKPSTVIMVIGESASAYYMSAYSDVKMIIHLG